MNKHDYLVDNVNSKSPVDSDHEVRSTKICSYQQDESTENCSFQQCGARGDRHMSTQGEFIEILSFRHFARYMQFSKTDPRGVKKEISTSIHVSVVMELV